MKPDSRLNTLVVHLHGRRIGSISRLAGDRHLFAFEPHHVDDPARPVLSLSFKGQAGGLVTSMRPVSRRLPPFFSNLLPEGRLRTYLGDRAGVNPEREFFLLAALGADLPGAVTVTPATDDHGEDQVFDSRPDRGSGPLRFSLAGVQLKFSAIMEAAGGLTIPAHGAGGSWIVKLPSAQFPAVPENEYAMLELARAIGIEVPEIRLVPVREIRGLPREAGRLAGTALAVQRFDRAPAGRRIHMEDFAQVFGEFPEDKYKRHSYANIASVLWAETGEQDIYEFVRRLAFSVAIGNGDMHLKNWSVLYPDGRTPALSPAYDFVSTVPYLSGDRLALTLGGSRALEAITVDQVRRFTDTAHLPMAPTWQAVQETLEKAAAAWNRLEAKKRLPREMRTTIGKQIQKVASGRI